MAPQRSRLQMILEINSALGKKKKRRHTERGGGVFSQRRPDPERAALLCSTFKTKFTFWTLNFSNVAAAFSCHFHPTSNEHEGKEKCTLPYLGLIMKKKKRKKKAYAGKKIPINSFYNVMTLCVRLPTEFIFPLPLFPFKTCLWTERVSAGQTIKGLVNVNRKIEFNVMELVWMFDRVKHK